MGSEMCIRDRDNAVDFVNADHSGGVFVTAGAAQYLTADSETALGLCYNKNN